MSTLIGMNEGTFGLLSSSILLEVKQGIRRQIHGNSFRHMVSQNFIGRAILDRGQIGSLSFSVIQVGSIG